MCNGGLNDAASRPRPVMDSMEHVGAKRGVTIGAIRRPSGSIDWMWEIVASVALIDSSGEASW